LMLARSGRAPSRVRLGVIPDPDARVGARQRPAGGEPRSGRSDTQSQPSSCVAPPINRAIGDRAGNVVLPRCSPGEPRQRVWLHRAPRARHEPCRDRRSCGEHQLAYHVCKRHRLGRRAFAASGRISDAMSNSPTGGFAHPPATRSLCDSGRFAPLGAARKRPGFCSLTPASMNERCLA
jgi:hypothetical protein